MGVNMTIIEGNLGRDPKTSSTQGGRMRTQFSIAVNESWQQNVEWKKHTEWVNVTAWGKNGERASGLMKGDWVFIRAHKRTSEYMPKGASEKKQFTEFVVDQLITKPGSAGTLAGGANFDDFGDIGDKDDVPF